MYYRQDQIHSDYQHIVLPQPQKTIFDDLLGSPVSKHYSLCCRIQDRLDVYQHVYAQHIEVNLKSQTGDWCGVNLVAAVEYVRDHVTHRIHHAFGPELSEKADIYCHTVDGSYEPSESNVHLLLIMNQEVYRLLGDDEQSSQDVLEEFIGDAWAIFQSHECCHPGWMTSYYTVAGGFYLNDYPGCKGIQALSVLLNSLLY